jgi:hypothetical protein
MIVDRGYDFPKSMQATLDSFGSDLWHFRDHSSRPTTRAVNIYRHEFRECVGLFPSSTLWSPAIHIHVMLPPLFEFLNRFEYLTSRIRISPTDLESTPLEFPEYLHFICSPERAGFILAEVDLYRDTNWKPFFIFEPIPVRRLISPSPSRFDEGPPKIGLLCSCGTSSSSCDHRSD